jgi:hypothetical protein
MKSSSIWISSSRGRFILRAVAHGAQVGAGRLLPRRHFRCEPLPYWLLTY